MKWNPLCLTVLFFVQISSTGYAQETLSAGLLPVEKVINTNTSVDKLFPSQYRVLTPLMTPATLDIKPNVVMATTTPGATTTPAATPTSVPTVAPAAAVGVKTDFQCNLFENSELVELSSAINALNQAVGTPACGGGSAIGAQSVLDNSKKIMDAVSGLQGFLANPEAIQPESAALISNNVDIAIRTANSLVTTLANTEVMNKSCRDQMNAGQVALAVNDIINGLTPYALMAASMTGGTAAVPFIVGGSVITGALSSMNKIVNESAKKMQDPKARRAILENTCQFIRLDQKYKFLIKNRDEQIKKISNDLSSSRRLFTTQMNGLSPVLGTLVDRQAALSTESVNLERQLTPSLQQLDMDKAFMTGTTDPVKVCQLGIQWSILASEKESYIDTILGSVDKSLAFYGSSSIAEARALKFSAQYALANLAKYAALPFSLNADFAPCAALTKSFAETMDQSAKFSKRLMKLAVENINQQIKGNSAFPQVQSQLDLINKKQFQANMVVGSLDNLKKYATSFVQSEIAAEMARLRMQVFGTGSAPITSWFAFTENLHNSSLKNFSEGLKNLRNQAYALTASGKTITTGLPTGGGAALGAQITKDWEDSVQLRPFDSLKGKKGTAAHVSACREIQDVWDRWVVAVDHLSALESLCGMIDPYIYDTRSEDRALVKMCRGNADHFTGLRTKSSLESLKESLIKGHAAEWALVLKAKVNSLGCLQ